VKSDYIGALVSFLNYRIFSLNGGCFDTPVVDGRPVNSKNLVCQQHGNDGFLMQPTVAHKWH